MTEPLTVADVGVIFLALETQGRGDVARRFAHDIAAPSRGDGELAELRAALEAERRESARLREELRKATEAARKRKKRTPSLEQPDDPRQVDMFPERPASTSGRSDVSPDAPCMHGSSSNKKRMIMRPAEVSVVSGDPDDPPAWAFELAASLRADLPEYEVRDLWRWFATRPHRDEADARDHFGRVLPKHKARSRAAPPAPPAPPSEPETELELEEPTPSPSPPPSSSRRKRRPDVGDEGGAPSIVYAAALLESVTRSHATGPPGRASSVA